MPCHGSLNTILLVLWVLQSCQGEHKMTCANQKETSSIMVSFSTKAQTFSVLDRVQSSQKALGSRMISDALIGQKI